MEDSYTHFLDTAKGIALHAGEVLKKYWGGSFDIREKSFAGDLVTEADNASELIILSALQRQFPTHSILSEESGLHEVLGTEYLWAVDPLDGTTNFAHHHPMFAISIALLHLGSPVVGVVYNPVYDELFTAALGQGTFLNGHPLHVSRTKLLSSALLATGFAYDRLETKDNNYLEFCELTNHTHGVRRLGAAALDLAYVAAGRLDGFWERGLKAWDVAAGILLVTEARGKVSSYENGPVVLESGRILASNGLIHEELSLKLEEARKPRCQ